MSPESSTSQKDMSNVAHISENHLFIPTIKAWRYYLEDQGVSINTVKAFTSDMNLLAKFLPPDRTLGAITTGELTNFLDWLQSGRNVPCSPKSLARRITSIKAFFRWLRKFGVLMIDPAEEIPQRSVISPLPTVMTLAETQSVISAAEDHLRASKPDARPYTLLTLLLNTGIKKGECLALSPNHIEIEAPNGPFLFIRYNNPQYRYKERKIPLLDSWIEAYFEYKSQYDLVDRLFPWSPRRLEYLLEDLSNEAGLDKHLSFDMCRWTCALNDFRDGMEHDKIRQKLGISKIQWREIGMKLQRLSGE